MTTHWWHHAAVVALLSGAAIASPAAASSPTPGGLPHATVGTAYVWGSDQSGQVDDVPTGDFVDLEAGYDLYTIGLTPDGQVKGWGTSEFASPPALPDGTRYVAIAAGDYTALALRSDGVIAQWGNVLPSGIPTAPAGTHYVQVAAGYDFGLALRSDGHIDAWGDNSYGATAVPPLPPGMRYTQIAASSRDGYALRSDGQVVAWGNDTFGQAVVPPPPDGSRYTKVVAQSLTAYALSSDGTISAWGDTEDGDTAVPPLPSGTRYVDVGIGSATGYAERSDGVAVAWGYDGSDHLATVPPAPPGMRFGDLGGANGISFGLLQRTTKLTMSVKPGSVTTVTVHAGTVDGTVPSGQVRITHAGKVLAHGTLRRGKVTLTLSPTPGKGLHHLVASYDGDRATLPQSTTFPVTLTKAPTRTHLRGPAHVRHGHRFSMHAKVSPARTGILRWYDGDRRLTTTRLKHGHGILRLHLTGRGKHRLHVVFTGTKTAYRSTSPTIKVVVR